MKIVTLITLSVAILFASGCSITAKEPREDIVARNAAQATEIAIRNLVRDEIKNRREEQFRAEQLLGQGSFGSRAFSSCGGNPCSPVAPSQPIYIQPPQQPQQPIYIQPPQASQPIYIQPPQVQQLPPQAQQPIYIQPPPPNGGMPPATPQSRYCVWVCESNGVNCGWYCGGDTSSFPTQPDTGTSGIENPHFHENKG